MDNEKLQEKFIEKIGAYATQSIEVIHRTKNFGKITKVDKLILDKLHSASLLRVFMIGKGYLHQSI